MLQVRYNAIARTRTSTSTKRSIKNDVICEV
jgi:hypothetical protein